MSTLSTTSVAVPLRPYESNQYQEYNYFNAQYNTENEPLPIPLHPSIPPDPATLLINPILPLEPSSVHHPNVTLSCLNSFAKPLPYSYLPDSSPIKRAWMIANGETPKAVRRVPRPKPTPKEDEEDGGLFAEFVKKLADEDEDPATSLKSSMPSTTTASPYRSSSNRSSRPPNIPVDFSRLGPKTPTASPLGDILFEIRRKKLVREASEAEKAARQSQQDVTATKSQVRIVSPTNHRRRSRTRSHSRSPHRTPTRSQSPRKTRQRPTPLPHHAKDDDEIDVQLLDSYLKPLGLSLTSLHSLSAKSIQNLAEAVASGSVQPVIPKKRGTDVGRPKKVRTDSSQHKSEKAAAEQNLQLAHFNTHTRIANDSATEFADHHPSLSTIPRLSSAPAPASGGRGLPTDPQFVRARQEAAEAKRRVQARNRQNMIRHEEEEEEEAPIQEPTSRNRPLEEVIPISAVEKLITQVGSSMPKSAPPTRPTGDQEYERYCAAVDEVHYQHHATEVAPLIESRTRAARVKCFDEMVRTENRIRLIHQKAHRQNRPTTADSSIRTADNVKPIQLTPKQIIYHIETASLPQQAYSLNGLFCRVVIRDRQEWIEMDQAIKGRQVPSSSSSPSSSPSTIYLSSSPMSFVTSSDFIEYLLLSPDRESEWLTLLGFERSWIEARVKDGMEFRLVVFRAEKEDMDKGFSPSSLTAFPASWTNILHHLPQWFAFDSPAYDHNTRSNLMVIINHLKSMADELMHTPWDEVLAIAKDRGLSHVYEGRDFMTFDEAALLIQAGEFDIVEARRFLENHLHLTCLFKGDGRTKPESHSRHEEVARHPHAAPTFAEYLIPSAPISSLPDIAFMRLIDPLGRRSASRSASRKRAHSSEPRSSYTMSGLPLQTNPSDLSQQVHAAHRRARSRSRTRVPTSIVDTGLKLKPGTKEYAHFKELKAERQAEEKRRQEEEQQKLRDLRRATVAKRATERKLELKKLKRKLKHDDYVPPLSEQPILLLPMPMLNEPSIQPSTNPSIEPSSAADDYADDEFHIDDPSSDRPSSSSQVVQSTSTETARDSSSIISSIAAVAQIDTKPTLNKKKPMSKKKKKRSPSSDKVDKSTKKLLSTKPPLPSFQFPAPPLPSSSSSSPSNHDVAGDAVAGVSSNESSVPAQPPTAANVDPRVVAELERSRRKTLLESQRVERTKRLKMEAQRAKDEEKKRKAALKALHNKCNQLARPQSATVCESQDSKSTTVGSSTRSSSQPRSRAPSSSPTRRRRELEEAVDDDDEGRIDIQIAHAIAQNDIEAFEAYKRREIEKLELKLSSLSTIAAKISDSSTTAARRVQMEHQRNLKEIASLSRKVGIKPKAVKDERIVISEMANRRISPLRPPPRPTITGTSTHAAESNVMSVSQPVSDSRTIDQDDAIPHGRVSRAFTPSRTESDESPSSIVDRSMPHSSPTALAPSPTMATLSASTPANSSQLSGAASTTDPRLQSVLNMAQTLSTRFSSLLTRVGDKHKDTPAYKEMVLNAALVSGAHVTKGSGEVGVQPQPTTQENEDNSVIGANLAHSQRDTSSSRGNVVDLAAHAINAEHESTDSSAPPEGILPLASPLIAQPPPISANVPGPPAASVSPLDPVIHDRILSDVVPPVHLQQPYHRIAYETSLQQHPLVDAPSSVLLPASLIHTVAPAGIRPSLGPLPHSNVSSEAKLFAEHIPTANQFVSSLPSMTPIDPSHPNLSQPLVFSFPLHSHAPPPHPYYDLATREYESLQHRIQAEKDRIKAVLAASK